jgi:glutathione peroxidase
MSLYDFQVTTIDGAVQHLDAYRGKTLLIVNVASQCGFTPQYAGLERLHQRYRDRGLMILAFPCDQFGGQEPGIEADIKRFCAETYDVTFPLFSKIRVNGADAHPLYEYLKSQKHGLLASKAIKWNFTKFLVSKHGAVLKRYAPSTTPERIEIDLSALDRRGDL